MRAPGRERAANAPAGRLGSVARGSVARGSVAHGSVARGSVAHGSVARGSVALVGAGPGDAGLATTRAVSLLRAADVVVVDRLVPRALLDEVPGDALVLDVGKRPYHHPVPQDEINALLVAHARAGRRVVRVKGGDPYVFGRGGEERDACEAAGVVVEVVPGVTSAVAVPAAVGIPLTYRGVANGFTVVTGHEGLAAAPRAGGHTLVLLMGVSRLRELAAGLVADGLPATTPVAVVEDCYGPRQRATVGTLATIADRAAERAVRAPAVTVVGEVVRFVDSIWIDPPWLAAEEPTEVATPRP